MWISKSKYEKMRKDACKFYDLIAKAHIISERKDPSIAFENGCILLSKEAYLLIGKQLSNAESKVANLYSELSYYKKEYELFSELKAIRSCLENNKQEEGL